MAMKKAEMEAHDERYHAIITDARAAIEQKHFKHALDLAVSAWEHVDGMMQYERKYEDREFKSLDCVEIVLQYAPLLLDAQRLDQLQVLLDSRRRVQKNTAADLGQKIYKSRSLLWDAHHFWDFIEREGSV